MGRWTQYDEDEYRLPEGLKRIGYDADTQKYKFVNQQGNIFESSEGASYGELTKVSGEDNNLYTSPKAISGDNESLSPMVDTEIMQRTNPYRALMPFFLIILVVILLAARLAAPAFLHGNDSSCETKGIYAVKDGDTCWGIAAVYKISVDDLQGTNTGIDCMKLFAGQKLCLPDAQ